MRLNKTSRFIISILICQLAGVIGSVFTSPSVRTWYTTIIKPSFNPPNWVFGPVWTTLFVLMAISLFIVWQKGYKINKSAINIFWIQLGLNTLWSIIFFGLHAPALAFIELAILWCFILLTILRFYKISKTAAYLLVPYILWVSFAAVLNLSIAILN